MKLLTTSPKIEKSDKANLGYLSTIMYLAPHKLSGYNVCSGASAGCISGCLNTSGFGGIYPSVQLGRIKRTKFFFEDRKNFFLQLRTELDSFVKKCSKNGVIPAVRLNGTSDLFWETLAADVIKDYSNITFYDYTKIQSRMHKFLDGKFPSNYTLTFSRSEDNDIKCRNVLLNGGNVAVVFATKNLPETYMGYPVFNGDHTDLRFLDPKNCVVGLYAKGKAKKDNSGFVVHTEGVTV